MLSSNFVIRYVIIFSFVLYIIFYFYHNNSVFFLVDFTVVQIMSFLSINCLFVLVE